MSDTTNTTEREYWPEHYCDETMPTGQKTPEAWLLGSAEGGEVWNLGPVDDYEQAGYGLMVAAIGSVVPFAWYEPRGSRNLTVHADGTWSLHGGEPADWTHVWDDDEWENSGDTVEELARHIHETNMGEETEATLCFGKWGDANFRLIVIDGAPRFEPAEATDVA